VSPPAAAARELRALYAEFDRESAQVGASCLLSGRCCDFDAYGHTLFASRLEVEVLVEEAGLEAYDPASRSCPFLRGKRCHARGPRPLGCRAFFCDDAKEEETRALHERFLGRLKGLHDRHGIAWEYAPLLGHLAGLLPAPGAPSPPPP